MLNRIIISLFMCLLSQALWSQSKATVAYYEKAINNSMYQGNDHSLYEHIEKLLIQHPGDPFAVLCYSDPYRMVDLFGIDKTIGLYRTVLRNLTANASPYKNILSLLIKEKLELLLYDSQPQLAKELTDSLAPVRTWALCGPYNKYGAYDLYEEFQPENLLTTDFIAQQGKSIKLFNFNGNLYPGRYIAIPKKTSAIVYALTSFSITSPVKIRITSNAQYKAFINGTEVIINKKNNFKNNRVIHVANTRNITLMLKIVLPSPSKNNPSFRVLVTDDNDLVVAIKPKIAAYSDSFTFKEVHDYPYANLVKDAESNPYSAYKNLGIYFDNLDSEQAGYFYRKALALHYDPVIDYLLAMALIRRGSGSESLYYNQGKAILQKLRQEHPLFIPTAHEKMLAAIQKKDYSKAIKLCKHILSQAPFHSETLFHYTQLLSQLGYTKEFENNLRIFKLRFPLSTYPLFIEAQFARGQNNHVFLETLQNMVKIRPRARTIRLLLKEYSRRGEYKKAILLALQNNHNQDYYPELAELFIAIKDLKTAQKLLFNEILTSNNPSAYFALGKLNFFANSDPVLYWKKMLSINPAHFSIMDYFSFKESSASSVFERYITSKKNIFNDLKKNSNSHYDSTVLQKTRVVTIYKNNKTLFYGSRVFCEDIVYIHNKNGIEKWGDYKIQFNGTIVPLRFRVYKNDGSYSDSYDFQKVNNSTIVNINSLEENSILHIAYIVENPLTAAKGSQLFYLSPRTIQDYYEPLYNFTLTIIAPRECPIDLFSSHMSSLQKTISGNDVVYSIHIPNHAPVHKENHSGSAFHYLPWYGFSAMQDARDFVLWYNGLIMDTSILNGELPTFKKNTVQETITEVYNYVAREIELMRNVLYYPEECRNTLANKSGSPEDKVILAKALLKKAGIESYIAFSRDKNLPRLKEHISPAHYTHILLMIPVALNNVCWLDFSSKYYPAGFVNNTVNHTEALIITRDSFKKATIEGNKLSERTSNYTIIIDVKGNASINAESRFAGLYGSMRSFFYNSLYQENFIHYYFVNMFPLIEIDNFNIMHLKDYSRPFSLAMSGKSPGFAIIGKNKLFFQPIIKKSAVYRYISSPHRKQPLFISSPINEKELYNYTVPIEYKNEIIAYNQKISSPFGSAHFVMTKNKGSQIITIKKEIYIMPTKIDPLNYEEFVRFCLQLKDIEYMNLALQARPQ